MMNTIYQITELCELGYTYGTDKCPQLKHSYTPFYYELWKDKRNEIKKILEFGIGYYPGMKHSTITYDRGLKRYYHRGASLYMWRDFFPYAQIYGADIQPETMFEDDRIKTYVCDEKKKEDIEHLKSKVGSDIDFVVDDALHRWQDQVFLAQTLMPLLNKQVTYIIEDAGMPGHVMGELKDYHCTRPAIANRRGMNQLVVVKHKVKIQKY